MKYFGLIILLSTFVLSSCKEVAHQQKNVAYQLLSKSKVPSNLPIPFREDLVGKDQLIHRGVFSPDLNHFYFTISDKDYSNFTIKSMHQVEHTWSEPQNAFFNSNDDDHGLSFSPDGNSIYFSSTRSLEKDSLANTWHLWRTTKVDDKWTPSEFIDIPNLRDKLISHPTITEGGRLYFHASNLDYSDMNIYYSDQVQGEFQDAKPLFSNVNDKTNKCTPFISPDEKYIIYAKIEEHLKLMICYKNDEGDWGVPTELNEAINMNGQGNPFVTWDKQFLFFASGIHGSNNWQLKWVSMDKILKTKQEPNDSK